MKATLMSLAAGAASTGAAIASGNEILSYVMIAMNALILISNTLLDIYRKWRDRDKDKTETTEKKDDKGGDDGAVRQ